MPIKTTEKKFKAIASDPIRRRHIAKSLLGFCTVYLPHYLTLKPADFHPELLHLLGDREERFLAIEGFRGSAKSSYAGTALVLWSALEGHAKFILSVNETDDVVKLTIANIREELESNLRIKQDYGDILIKSSRATRTKFTETNIVLANGCRIFGRSRGQKIRGLRHKQYRPDMVVADDIEEIDKVQKKEYRDRTEAWIKGTVIPAVEETKARLVVLGNRLHMDAIMERLKKNPTFTYRAYALFKGGKEDWEHCTWKAKYPSQRALDAQEAKVGRTMWLREYCLKVVPPEGQIIKEEWLQRYKKLPAQINKVGTGVDLAISQKTTADFTAMVSGVGTRIEGMPKIYILPGPINKRLTLHETLQQMISLRTAHRIHSSITTFYIEDVAYQKAAIQEARRKLLQVKEMRAGQDKRARLESVAAFVQNGTVEFPEKGCEELLNQLLYLGVEEHDDLADAFVYLILGLAESGLQEFKVISIV
ncbi:MAG: hypothetical protein M3P98_01510 [bacterium]|nr:hypothetical protein [bacterium]